MPEGGKVEIFARSSKYRDNYGNINWSASPVKSGEPHEPTIDELEELFADEVDNEVH